ncbi:two-component regulator propeller domain-containing protein [Pontibacter beigongshangensis]|uniref:two-component regulator propeller domain-containing protein n=1 Tax=Pontibacter beigongshangensis TaxID=2574733 RepID=UPI00164F703A|nr:two-component regulator propeller domain-containing protein [Pontibacter beigongshangensis]
MQHSRCTGHCLRWLIRLLLILCCPVSLQGQQYNFRNWTQEHGLPQSQVNAILQDNKGQLWLGTRSGLGRFNGISFTTFTKRQGLSSNHITSLLQDSRNQLWIGTARQGIMLFNGSEFKPAPRATPHPTGKVNSLAEDNKGRIWAATGNGLFVTKDNTFTRSSQFPAQAYTAVLSTAAGEVWAGSAANGLLINGASGTLSVTAQTSLLPSNNINCLWQGTDSSIWVGTSLGVAVFRQGQLTNLALPASIRQPDVIGFAQDADQNIWIGLRHEGILKYNGRHFEHLTKRNGLKTNHIAALTSDSEGNIWIGTNGQGLQQYRNPWFTHYFNFGEINEFRVTTLSQDTQGRLMIGTEDGHTALMEREKLQWIWPGLWPRGTILHDIRTNQAELFWVCTSNGVWQITPAQTTHYTVQHGLPSNEVYQCLSDPPGNLWFATAGGIARFSNGRFSAPFAPALGKVHQLHLDSRNILWAGTENGIFRERNGAMEAVPALKKFNFREVYSIAEDSLGNLYFGGYDQGLLILDQNLQYPRVFDAANGLPDESILSLYIDNLNFLWVGTSRSVLKASLSLYQQQKELTFKTYTAKDGFRGREVSRNSITQTPDGTVWFGTARGLTSYTHRLDKLNRVYPKTFLTSIDLFMQPADWQELGFKTDTATGLPADLQLRYDQNHVTFSFQGISLSNPEQVRYRYRLIGLQDNWSGITARTSATYANLNPGNYTFQVMARNNDGFWTPAPASYSFSLAPPVWKREWFITVLLLVVAGAVISLIRLRERNLVKQNSLLEQRVQHRTRMLEEKNREKETLLKEIHHRVKNNLQIVISLLNLQTRHLHDPESIQVMRALRNRVQSMAILHERLYQHEDLAQIDLANYFTGICESLYSSFGTRPEQVALHLNIPHLKVDIDSAITLGLIVNELVSNTLKYAFPNGQKGWLHISLEHHTYQTFKLTIADSGVGMPADFDPKSATSFGLRLVNSLVKKLNGRLELKTDKGATNTLYFDI